MAAKMMIRTVVACVLVVSVASAADGWVTDWEAAKASAAKSGKDILLDFTGSDWCGWCVKLNREVFTQDAFKAYADPAFVLLEADFPRKTQLSPELQAQNQKLYDQFGVKGFPTIVLTDAQGLPYASTGYRDGGAAAYVEHLKELQQIRTQRDAALAQAKDAQGLQRATFLAAALTPLPVALLGFYGDLIKEIQGLDQGNETGFKAKLAERELLGLEGEVEALSRAGQTVEALGKVDGFIAANQAVGELQQKALMLKLAVYPPRTMENLVAADALMDRVIAIDAATATAKQCQAIKAQIVDIKAKLNAKPAEKPAP